MATYTGPYPVVFTTSQMLVSNTTFSGGIANTGTIGPGGIDVNNSTLLSGGILDEGVVLGGIDVDSKSKITTTGTAIAVENTSTFAGGISNAGTLSAGGVGIEVGCTNVLLIGVTDFSGGIINKGSISASKTGIVVSSVVNFSGGVTNNGAIVSGISGTVAITDPVVPNGGSVEPAPTQALPRSGLDLPNIAFGAQTTLAYSENSTDTAGTLTVTDGRHAASIALLGNYMAGSFITAADGYGGTLVTEASQTEQPLLTRPHG